MKHVSWRTFYEHYSVVEHGYFGGVYASDPSVARVFLLTGDERDGQECAVPLADLMDGWL